MSGEAVGWAFRKVQMDDPTAKFVLVAICNYANEQDQAWPSHAAIARLTGLSKRTIQNAIQKLEDWGIIKRDRRDRDNGSETSAMVSIDLNVGWVVKGGVASPAIGVVQQVPGGIAADSTLETTVKPKGKTPKSKDEAYSEDFETLWQQYPRTKNTSKKDAWNFYRMMTDDKQEMVRRAVPLFAVAMRSEGRTEDKIMHMIRFLRGGVYETVAPPLAPAAAGGAAKPFWETATRQDWVSVLRQWSMNWNWKAYWGPEPENPLRPNPAGAPKHHVPQDILDRFDLKYRGHLYSPEQKAEIQARVEAASKHSVDKDRAV